ncbi:MAG: DegV family protein [Clostridia bacterium]|nr:DegV family protein [Clostridia bacterium]
MYTIFTDSDTDLTLKEAKEIGYKLISMSYSYGGKTIFPYEDYEEFDSKAYYDMLRAGTLPTTSAIGKEKYISYFEPEFAAGRDVLYVHFSRAMSMTFENMDEAVAELKAKYPERKFYELDTHGITAQSLIIVYEVGDMYNAGKSPEEILEWAKTEIYNFSLYFFSEDLKFFHRSGRVSGLAAAMGTLVGVRPIITMTADGKMVAVGKARGRKNAVEALFRYIEEKGDDIKGHRILIPNTGAPELAAEVEQKLRERFGADLNIIKVTTNPTAGAHCGPDGLGIAFHSVRRD